MSLTHSSTRRTVGYVSLLAALLLAFNALLLATPASADGHHPDPGPGGVEVVGNTPNQGYCAGYDGGHRADEGGDHTADEFSVAQNDDGTITVTAADGYVISLVLVKAGENHYRYEVSTSGGTFQGPRADSVSNWVVCWDTEPPTEVTPLAPTFIDPTCDVNVAGLVLPDGPTGVTYQVTGDQQPDGTVTVTAVAGDGYTFPAGATTEWEHTYDPAATDCDEPEEPQEPQEPEEPTTGVSPDVVVRPAVAFLDPDCDDPDAADVVLTEVDGIAYTVTGDVEPGGTVTVTATAEDGHRIPRGQTTTWTHEFVEPDCDVEVLPSVVEKPQAAPAAPAAQQLAATGMDSTEMLLLAILLMGLGATTLLAPPARREH